MEGRGTAIAKAIRQGRLRFLVPQPSPDQAGSGWGTRGFGAGVEQATACAWARYCFEAGCCWGGGTLRLHFVGQEELEDGAVAGGGGAAAYAEEALVFVDDLEGDPEAQAGPDIGLGGEEGVEDVGEGAGGDAAAGVGDGDADAGLRGVAGASAYGVAGA